MNVQNKTSELIALGRQEVVLDEQRLEHNRARVLSRVAAAGLVATSVAASGSMGAAASTIAAGKAGLGGVAAGNALGSLSLAKLALVVAVVGGSAAGSYALATRTAPKPVSARVLTTSRPAVPMRTEAPLGPEATLVEPAPSALPAEGLSNASARATATSMPRATASSLSEHADLLRETRTALAAGDVARALMLLDSHREIAQGPLGPEWSAARILVLCRLGRSAEAKQAGQKFLKSRANSPLAAQVRTSCGGQE